MFLQGHEPWSRKGFQLQGEKTALPLRFGEGQKLLSGNLAETPFKSHSLLKGQQGVNVPVLELPILARENYFCLCSDGLLRLWISTKRRQDMAALRLI